MRNLLGRLHDRSPHDLDLIARWWEVTLRGRDHHAVAGRLYRVLIDSWAFALAWQRLSPTDRVILDLLVEDEAAHPLVEIAAQLNAPVASVLPSLRRLYRAGYLFAEQEAPEDERRLFLPRETAGLTARLRQEETRGLPLEENVTDLLDRLPDGELADMAEQLGYRILPILALRPDLIAYLKPRVGDPDIVAASIASLSRQAANFWAWLNSVPAPPSPDDARDKLGLSGTALREVIWQLAQRGLLWRGYTDGHELRLVVPEPVRHPRRAAAAPLPALVTVEEAAVDPVEWLPNDAAAWDLQTLLRLRLDGDRSLGEARTLRLLSPALWRRAGDMPPTGYASFMLRLAEGLGLADAQGVDRRRVRDWTRLSFAEQTKRLLAIWKTGTEWPEGAERETLQVWGADWAGFRARLLQALAAQSPGAWLTLSSFAARFAAEAPDALGGSFTATGTGELEQEPDIMPGKRRQAVVQVATEMTLATACTWLGLVRLSRSRREAVFTLSPLGAALLDPAREPPADERLGDQPLSVLPNFEVLLLQPAPRRLWVLSAFADLVALDRVSRYQLTRQSAQRGLASGISTEQIVRFLERESGEVLPQNVAFELGEWARAFRRVRVSQTLLLAPDDTSTAADIAEALRLQNFAVEQLDDGRLLVTVPGDDPVSARHRIEDTLRRLGSTPLAAVPPLQGGSAAG